MSALGALAPTVFGAAGTATAFGGALGAGTIGGAAATAGLGSLAGNLLAGRNFKDSAKAALITGATAGLTKGIGNKMAGKSFMGTTQSLPEGAGQSVGAPGYRGGVTGTGLKGTGPFTGSGASEMPLLGEGNIAEAQYGNAATQAAQPVGTKFGSSAVDQAIAGAPVTSSYTSPQPIDIMQRNVNTSAFTPTKTPLNVVKDQEILRAAQAGAPVEQTFASKLVS